ncbi:DUF2478 domain-containing protein [Roseobacteraceae bacterium NS-SX3]
MHIAYTMSPQQGDMDQTLERLAARLQARGLRLCGTVQINTGRADGGRCDMDVRVLPDGPVIRISQSLGREARGCRLDPEALETAVAAATAALEQGADILLVNKFGKHEAEGRGFRGLIAEALARGVPVLVGVNALNERAFEEFTVGCAERLPLDPAALETWLDRARVASLKAA